VIAVSCHTREDVGHAESENADLALFASVFEKFEKKDAAAAGLAALREACRAKIPILALGGVTLGNAAACLDAGAAGIAAIRLFQENKIEDVICALRSP
jgi:thiamine-phosphate pyrophosphorylase